MWGKVLCVAIAAAPLGFAAAVHAQGGPMNVFYEHSDY